MFISCCLVNVYYLCFPLHLTWRLTPSSWFLVGLKHQTLYIVIKWVYNLAEKGSISREFIKWPGFEAAYWASVTEMLIMLFDAIST